MSKVVAAVQSFALTLGAPGLFLVALLDSSLLSLPQVPDLLLIFMVTQHPSLWLVYALMTTAGSVAGCVGMYLLARKGGERVLRKMVSAERMERGRVTFQKWGLLAVLVPSILPPPAPFKLFVLLAGVVQIPLWQFVAAIGLGRGFRYVAGGPAGALVRTAGDDVSRREPAAGFARAGSRPGARRGGLRGAPATPGATCRCGIIPRSPDASRDLAGHPHLQRGAQHRGALRGDHGSARRHGAAPTRCC